MNLLAVGLFTGHVDRLLRRMPFNNLLLWDSMGDGCSGCFGWLIALGIFFWTIASLVVTAVDGIKLC